MIGGSAGAGAGVGAIAGGKKGALIGAAIGGGAGTLYEIVEALNGARGRRAAGGGGQRMLCAYCLPLDRFDRPVYPLAAIQ